MTQLWPHFEPWHLFKPTGGLPDMVHLTKMPFEFLGTLLKRQQSTGGKKYSCVNMHKFHKKLTFSYFTIETFSNCHATHENVNLLEFEQKQNCDLILTLSWPFFIRFLLRIPQNDQTDSPQKNGILQKSLWWADN